MASQQKKLQEQVKAQLGNAYAGVSISNFSKSWNDGLAFCALMHRHFPNDIGPFDELDGSTPAGRQKNFELAFGVAEIFSSARSASSTCRT